MEWISLMQYMVWESTCIQLHASAGIGMEYTYNLWFVPSNLYGSAPVQRRNVEITPLFTSVGFSLGYSSKSVHNIHYIISLFYETDAWFNPVRYNEYNFWQNRVPLLSHQLFTTFTLQYRL